MLCICDCAPTRIKAKGCYKREAGFEAEPDRHLGEVRGSALSGAKHRQKRMRALTPSSNPALRLWSSTARREQRDRVTAPRARNDVCEFHRASS